MPFRSTRLCVDTRHACAHVNSDMARGFQVNSVCNIFRIPPLVYSGSTSLGEFPRFCFVKRTSQKWVHVTQRWQNCFEKAPRVTGHFRSRSPQCWATPVAENLGLSHSGRGASTHPGYCRRCL